MYVVLLDDKNIVALRALMPELSKAFPNDVFTIVGTEEKGYKLRIEGAGDEKPPRVFAANFLKNWKKEHV